MKLIDLLVQELPKRGGWPEGGGPNGIKMLCQGFDGELEFVDEKGKSFETGIRLKTVVKNHRACAFDAHECDADVVTREQYEAALNQPTWTGEGIPPVGCECEAFDGISWYPAVIIGRYDGFAFAWNYDHRITFTINEEHTNSFRPIRTEDERKREETIKEIARHVTNFNKTDVTHAIIEIYDAISDGKIPNITLK